jgi:hypothetical protein
MRIFWILAALGTSLGSLSIIYTQVNRPADPVPRVTVHASPVSTPAATTVVTHLKIEIAEGFHIQANPASDDYLIPARLSLSGADTALRVEPVYPIGKAYRLKGSEQQLSVYDHATLIAVRIESPSHLAPGSYVLRGALQYQACDHKTCYLPAIAHFDQPVEVTPRSEGL